MVVFALLAAGFGLAHRLGFGTTHADVVGCHFLRGFVVFAAFWTNPDDAFTQVDASGWHCAKVETFGFSTARTRHDHDFRYLVITFGGDVGFDHVHASLTAQEVVGFTETNAAFTYRDGFEGFGVKTFADTTTRTQITTNFHLMLLLPD